MANAVLTNDSAAEMMVVRCEEVSFGAGAEVVGEEEARPEVRSFILSFPFEWCWW